MYATDIQMNKKRLRIIFSVSEEEYKNLKELSGIASLSAYIRSRLFGKDTEIVRDVGLNQWIDLLLQIPDRDKIFQCIVEDAKERRGGRVAEMFITKLFPMGYK